ncbi:carbon monoxide dehydrogenase subunit G [Streptomyces venezuelae]|uniref:Carbon monoxide dehydrogenase subunit G n=1 Tax=Streptomyces venezuelae TaxID=54571 RepID=A0A5P2CKV2_STRVZ|nr:SRPBCC family protein [Streptomyces venezuelae]QES42817.1 carbon monoxide dehydrogenase subunit G [Streptomyces venezuelae]
MEHEVFVPVSAERLRQVLADPERVAGAVPGLQRDEGRDEGGEGQTAGPLSGRLKVRVDGHSITYRGSARTDARKDGTYALEAEGEEVRGSGSVKFTLTVRLEPLPEGTNLVFGGSGTADGRITEGSPQAVESAVHRLLDRFAEALGAGAPPDTAPEEPTPEEPASEEPPTHTVTVFRTEVPPPSLDPLSDADDLDDVDDLDDDGINLDDTNVLDDADDIEDLETIEDLEDLETIGVPPAEAAHARRTMIGRSAEEVDHAPPRGRYAPAPAPESLAANATLRWAAPAAALALASAIVVGRALRRRR